MKSTLYERVFEGLASDDIGGGTSDLVLAACDRNVDLADLLDTDRKIAPSTPRQGRPSPLEIRRADLHSLMVQGFRGIGPSVELKVRPGPGLTLVIGRNGSGKSSFAEGLETLLTGQNSRWADRGAKVEWVGGWRNLHHEGSPEIKARFLVEGEAEPVEFTRRWPAGEQDFAAGELKGDAFDRLGWDEALIVHRPLLSYNELGALFEKPSGVYDALRSILGLEELNDALSRLVVERKRREQPGKDERARRKELLGQLPSVDDPRALVCATALSARKPDLASVQSVIHGTADEEASRPIELLKRIAGMKVPAETKVQGIIESLRSAAESRAALTETRAERSSKLAELLSQAVGFYRDYKDQDCPVCGQKDALDDRWATNSQQSIDALRQAASRVRAVEKELNDAVSLARQTIRSFAPQLESAEETGLDIEPLRAALALWSKGLKLDDAVELAGHLESAYLELAIAAGELASVAADRVAETEEVWRPVARRLVAWVELKRQADDAADALSELKAAEKWLKAFANDLRDERFEPIADHAKRIWATLSRGSNVDLARVELTGSGTRRKVRLNVTVDGTDGVALGVMSQGELHALSLALFIPRVMLDESPFRFVVIDDPVQSMDPVRVDGLARVLEEVAQKRQVIVFTHDQRLFEAVRRLQIEADVREVQRRGNSVVEVRRALDPVSRYLEDARRVTYHEDTIGSVVAGRVVPGLCRMALEAVLTAVVRRRRLGRGERHLDVEQLIERAQTLLRLSALAFYDDEDRAGDVWGYLKNKYGNHLTDVFRVCNEGAHTGYSGYKTLVRDAERLTHQLETLH